ncbi:MAG: hypothetical protein Q8J76_14195, partial [Desulfobulbaceae bacterium]|nr:hypothetical protein [Desulfobulbaceae bacterium]
FDRTNGGIYYFNSLGGWTLIDTLPPWATATYLFHVAKLDVDLDTLEYVSLIIDGAGYSLAGISGRSAASASQPYFVFAVNVYGPGGTNPVLYVDDMIITQNEP